MTTFTEKIRLPSQRARTRSTLRQIARGAIGIVAFLLIWQTASTVGLINPRYLPPPTEVAVQLVALLFQAWFWDSLATTLLAWLVGLAIACVAGVILGFGIGSSRFFRRATHSTIEFLRPIPSVALVPLAVLLFGVRIESSLLLIVYASVWPMLIQTLYGAGDVDMVADATARSYGFGWVARLRYVALPTASPYLLTGLRISAAYALILAVTAGLVIGSPGLGRDIAVAKSSGAVGIMYALIVVAGILGLSVNIAMRAIERRTLSWHTSVRSELPS